MGMNRKANLRGGMSRREMLKYGLYGGLAAGLSGSLWLSGCRKQRGGERPSIILITVDAVRADHLGCYGYSKNTSPNIDRFATEALLFENCLAHAPDTRYSFASILSGFLPHETKITETHQLAAAVKTVPEILRQEGYKTVAVISNFVMRKKQGFEQGFIIYDDTMRDRELVRRWPERVAERTTDRAIELLKEFHKDQLFMWIHYQDPHGPYTPPERLARLFRNPAQKPRNLKLNTSLSGRGGIPFYQRLGTNRDFYDYVARYDGEIRYQDEHFKHLVDVLKELGLYDEALIIFSSDHGEGMGEHNYFFAHGENLYADQLHVPLIIRYGEEPAGRRSDFVQHLDVVPTIFKALGMKMDSRFRGRDLLKQNEKKREIFAEMKSPLVRDGIKFCVVFDGLKLIYTRLFKKYELFNLKSDPHEEHDLINDPKYRERAGDLKIRLKRIREEDFLGLRVVKRRQKLTEEEIRKLKSLGYVE